MAEACCRDYDRGNRSKETPVGDGTLFTFHFSPPPLPCFFQVAVDEAVKTEIIGERSGKPVASLFHSVLNPMRYCVIHEFFNAASFPPLHPLK